MSETIVTCDDTCKNCPDRCVGCHNVETCSKWAAHEEKKKEVYAIRLNVSHLKSIEQAHVNKFYKNWLNHHGRDKK